jgi:stage II sporulation protein M
MKENFRTYSTEIFEALMRTKNFILISFALFVFGIIIGFVIYHLSPGNEFFSLILKELENIGVEFGEKNTIEMIVFIFLHNLQAVAMSIISGIILIFPVIFMLVNGMTIGFFLGAAGNPLILIAIIPHGIFEIPALVISAAMGMRLGFVIMMPEKGKTRFECAKEVSRDIGKILILIIPLLLIAAVIEVTISARLADMML